MSGSNDDLAEANEDRKMAFTNILDVWRSFETWKSKEQRNSETYLIFPPTASFNKNEQLKNLAECDEHLHVRRKPMEK